MFDLDKWQEVWFTISHNKSRSILTGFGVFWGIFMLVILIGAGNSMKIGMYKNFDGFASNSCFFSTNLTSEPYKGYRKGRSWNITNKDIIQIQKKSSALEYISPMLFAWGTGKNVVFKQKSGSYGSRGVYPDHFKIEGQHLLAGRLFNSFDLTEKRKVCVIGLLIAQNLFGDNLAAIGNYIRVNGIYFQVIGVIKPKSRASIGGDVEETVFIPFSTMQQTFKQGDHIDFMACTAKKGRSCSELEEEIKTILKQANEISPTDKRAVRSFNIEKQFQIFDRLFRGIDILIWIIGIGSLLTGIVGISNIMLVTVRERTREIGVRRALGASPITILTQIMTESFTLTAIAGLGGFMLGVGILVGINKLTEDIPNEILAPPMVSFNVAVLSMIILIFSGLLAGLIPSIRALRIKAIDAIRDE